MLHKHEDLNSSVENPYKDPSLIVHICNPDLRRQRWQDPGGMLTRQCSQTGELQIQYEVLFQKVRRTMIPSWSDWKEMGG